MQEESEGRSGLLLITKLLTFTTDNSRRTMMVSVVWYRCCTPITSMKNRSKLKTIEGGVMPAEIKESLVDQCRRTGGRTS